jgi:hypothetical protein
VSLIVNHEEHLIRAASFLGHIPHTHSSNLMTLIQPTT